MPADAGPELVHRDVEVVYGDHQIDQQPVHDLFQPRIANAVVETGRFRGEGCDDVLLDQVGWHGRSPQGLRFLRYR
jgi:hypothetical protein